MTEPTARAWHESYPPPRNKQPATVTAQDLLARLKRGGNPGRDFLLIDLRRTDHEGGTIRGSLNLPAQSLYSSLPTLLGLCRGVEGLRMVIWYCGSSRGRGTRAAGWFDDLIHDQGVSEIESVVLEGGVAGWVKGGPEYTAWMDEYDPNAWKS